MVAARIPVKLRGLRELGSLNKRREGAEMRMAMVLVLLVALIAGPVPSVLATDLPEGALGQGPIHQSVSLVTQIDRAAGLVIIRLDDGRLVRLHVDEATAGDTLAALEPGDVIREHCTRVNADMAKALLIRRVRTASMEIGSFEQ